MKEIIYSWLIVTTICILVSLGGCKPNVEYVTRVHTINNTVLIYEEKEVIKYVNVTEPCYNNETNLTYESKYMLRLIRELKACEYRELDMINNSDCVWELDKCVRDLNKSNTKLEEIKEVI